MLSCSFSIQSITYWIFMSGVTYKMWFYDFFLSFYRALSLSISVCCSVERTKYSPKILWRTLPSKNCCVISNERRNICCCLCAWIVIYTLVHWFVSRSDVNFINKKKIPSCQPLNGAAFSINFFFVDIFACLFLSPNFSHTFFLSFLPFLRNHLVEYTIKMFEWHQVICELVSILVIIIHLFMTMRSSKIIKKNEKRERVRVGKKWKRFEQPQNWLSKRIPSAESHKYLQARKTYTHSSERC